jgi:hypothetical protein
MDISGIITLIKQIVDTVVEVIPAIKTVFEGISSLFKARSQTSDAITAGFGDIAKSMERPEDREKIDVERVRVFAELTRSVVPFAFVEYLFYVTKVAGLIGLAYVFYYWWYRLRSKLRV